MLRRFLSVWLVLSSVLAFWWPDLWSRLGSDGASAWDPFYAGIRTISGAIMLTMFCIGALLPPDELRQLARQWPSVLFGACVQYVSMPLLAWLAILLWGFTDDLRIGVLIVGCVPGAMASNVLTLVARGNVSYSVGLTTAATLLSPLVVPAALRVTAGATISQDVLVRISLELVWMVVLPVTAGFVVARSSRVAERILQRGGETAAQLAILWIIAVVVGRQREYLSAASSLPVLTSIGAALAFVNMAGYLAGYASGAVAGLDARRRRALTIEVGMQNAGVGTQLVIAVLGGESTATIPTVMYTFGCMLTGTLLAQAFGWYDQHCRHEQPLVVEAGEGPRDHSAATR